MKICFLGEFSGNLDEGMRITSFHLARELSKKNIVLRLDLRDAFSFEFWQKIQSFRPDIVHYIHGPTIKSFLILKLISAYIKNSKSILSAMRPVIPYHFRLLIPILKPDLILVQSYATESMFKSLGCKIAILPCGVDIHRFSSKLKTSKDEIRRKYGISSDKFLITHIGSIKKGRNVSILSKLQRNGNQVLIIGSSSTGVELEILRALEESGCIVQPNYIKNIEDVYFMSDCYIFPTVNRFDLLGRAVADSIEMPLSVLEAMSFNLPVICTDFGAISRFFRDGEGIFFFKSEKDINKCLERLKGCTRVQTRDKILPYSWEKVGCMLEEIYLTIYGE